MDKNVGKRSFVQNRYFPNFSIDCYYFINDVFQYTDLNVFMTPGKFMNGQNGNKCGRGRWKVSFYDINRKCIQIRQKLADACIRWKYRVNRRQTTSVR